MKLLRFLFLILLVSGATTRCRATPTPSPTPRPTPSPTTAPAALFPPPQPGDGSDLLDQLLETGVIRVGLRVWPHADFSPPAFRGYSNAETGGALNGMEVDIARWIATGLGLELEFVEAYPPVLSTGDWRGQWDIAFGSLAPFDQPPDTAHTPLLFSTPYAYMPMSFLTPESDPPLPIANLTGQPIGALEYSAWYDLLFTPTLTVEQQPVLTVPTEWQAVPISNMSHAIRQLGQPDPADAPPPLAAIFGPTPVLQAAISEDWPVQLAVEPEIVGYQPQAIAAVPRDELGAERLITALDRILHQLQRQGTLAEIHLKWYGQNLSQPPASE